MKVVSTRLILASFTILRSQNIECALNFASTREESSSRTQFACGDIEVGVYYKGYSSRRDSVSSYVECREQCQTAENCQYWSWFAGDSEVYASRCYFGNSKTSRTDTLSASKAFSGKRYCEYIQLFFKTFQRTIFPGECADLQKNLRHTNYQSSNLRIARIENVTWDRDCRSMCDRTPDCVAWQNRLANVNANTNACHLLKNDTTLLPATQTSNSFNIGKKNCGDCSKAVLDFNKRDGIQQAVVDKVLEEDLEIDSTNYWLSPVSLRGEDSFLVIDLGCIKEISGVYLRNTHNGNFNDRGTKRFSLKFRIETTDPWNNWNTEHGTTLERVYSTSLKKTKWVPFASSLAFRYLKFVVEDFYGNGGGLSYIGVHEAGGGEASSYPGNKLSIELLKMKVS